MADMSGSLKTIFYALAANSAIALAKFGAAMVTGSGAMLAEAVHSLADAGNQLLLLLGLKRAKRPPSNDFPLGYGKEIYFWSFIVALMLFSVGGLFSINEGWHKLQNPEPLNRPWLAVGVLVFAFFAEGSALFGCIREINKVRGNKNLWQWFRTSRQSELIVIFGEDVAALLGLSAAIIAIVATIITGNPMYDALGSIAIGTLLVVVAFLLGAEVKDLLIGQGVEDEVHNDMKAFLEAQEEVDEVLNLITLQLGPDVMVAIKARLAPRGGTHITSSLINDVEARFRERYSQVAWLFFEPDIAD
jgi:cation diffusion facilitator family transporter